MGSEETAEEQQQQRADSHSDQTEITRMKKTPVPLDRLYDIYDSNAEIYDIRDCEETYCDNLCRQHLARSGSADDTD